jgi:hypothetical protein
MSQNDQIMGRLVFALSLYLTHANNDADGSKVRAILDTLQREGEASLDTLPSHMQQEGAGVLRSLLSRAAEMAFALPPRGPQSQQ